MAAPAQGLSSSGKQLHVLCLWPGVEMPHGGRSAPGQSAPGPEQGLRRPHRVREGFCGLPGSTLSEPWGQGRAPTGCWPANPCQAFLSPACSLFGVLGSRGEGPLEPCVNKGRWNKEPGRVGWHSSCCRHILPGPARGSGSAGGCETAGRELSARRRAERLGERDCEKSFLGDLCLPLAVSHKSSPF